MTDLTKDVYPKTRRCDMCGADSSNVREVWINGKSSQWCVIFCSRCVEDTLVEAARAVIGKATQ